MKIYWVLGYDKYYPSADNFMASFETYEEAAEYAAKRPRNLDYYDVINISHSL
jgi:hypothetical protein